jgi:hypothetical protein
MSSRDQGAFGAPARAGVIFAALLALGLPAQAGAHSKPHHAARHSSQAPQPAPSVQPAPIAKPGRGGATDPQDYEHQTLQIQQRLADDQSALITLSALIAAIGAVQGAVFLLTLIGTIRAANAMKKAAEIGERSLIMLEGPYGVIDEIEFWPLPSAPVSVEQLAEFAPFARFKISNQGRSVAIVRELLSEVAFYEELPEEPEFVEATLRKGVQFIEPNKQGPFVTTIRQSALTQEEFELVANGKLKAFFYGHIKYADIMGNLHTTGWCLGWRPRDGILRTEGGTAYNYHAVGPDPAQATRMKRASLIDRFVPRRKDSEQYSSAA